MSWFKANHHSPGTYDVGIHAANIDNKNFYLIDTPGFDDTIRSDTEILREVAD